MPDGWRDAQSGPVPPDGKQLLLPFGDSPSKRSPTVKVYREGFQITVREGGILIETVDYHARPLFLDAVALAELGLAMFRESVQSP